MMAVGEVPVSRARATGRECEREAWVWGESSGLAGPFIGRGRGEGKGRPAVHQGGHYCVSFKRE